MLQDEDEGAILADEEETSEEDEENMEGYEQYDSDLAEENILNDQDIIDDEE